MKLIIEESLIQAFKYENTNINFCYIRIKNHEEKDIQEINNDIIK